MTEPAPEIPDPPKCKYQLTLIIDGNTFEEIEGELISQTRGGFLLASDYYQREEWTRYSGRVTSKMEVRDPDMTAERFSAELDEWARQRRSRS